MKLNKMEVQPADLTDLTKSPNKMSKICPKMKIVYSPLTGAQNPRISMGKFVQLVTSASIFLLNIVP